MKTLFLDTYTKSFEVIDASEKGVFPTYYEKINTKSLTLVALPIVPLKDHELYYLLMDEEAVAPYKETQGKVSTFILNKLETPINGRKFSETKYYGSTTIIKCDVLTGDEVSLSDEDIKHLINTIEFQNITKNDDIISVAVIYSYNKEQLEHYENVVAQATEQAKEKDWKVIDHKRFPNPQDDYLIFVAIESDNHLKPLKGDKKTYSTHLFNTFGGFSSGHYDLLENEVINDLDSRC